MPNGGASDANLKVNVVEVETALERVLALRPVTWSWKDDTNEREYGFIAQEVEKIFPELVSVKKWKDGTSRKFLLTKGLLPYLIKALDEQEQQITLLSKRLADLEARIKIPT